MSVITWDGASGRVSRIAGAKDCYYIVWQKPDLAGNWIWGYYPDAQLNAPHVAAYTFVAKRIVWTDGVPVAYRADGSSFDPRAGEPTPVQTPAPVDPLPSPPPAIPPVVPTPPVTPTAPQDGSVKVFRVVVVPLRYQPPAKTADMIAFNAYTQTLPKVTQSALQQTFAPLQAWWLKETYGLRRLDVTVLPATNIDRVAPGCDFYSIMADGIQAMHAANAVADQMIFVTTYSCWQSHMVTAGPVSVAWNTSQDQIGEYAHELGHQFGLNHTASRMPTYLLEGAGSDIMCGPGPLSHIRADHKTMLGVLKPLVVTSGTYTLRSIFDYPDALNVGLYTVEFNGEDGCVWLSLREYVENDAHGGSDTTLLAKLAVGQMFTVGGHTFAHVTLGKVVVG